jgi:penicillin-insensitive murein endopeptidase
MKAWIFIAIGMLWLALAWGSEAVESRCFGRPGEGRLEQGWPLPYDGPNFRAYSGLGWVLGRTYVHSRVQRTILRAYRELESKMPDRQFIYAETGFEGGGPFWPHVTHQNGLSADFMVPVLNREGKPVDFPGFLWNRFGYDLEFDAEGNWQGYRIDFEALAEHLYQLHRAARTEGIRIRIVIFAPELTKQLFQSARGKYLRKQLDFYRQPARMRHDEHYHVDFLVSCVEP